MMATLDSHFHLSSLLAKDPGYRLPDDIIGIDVATDAGDLEGRARRAPAEGTVFFSAGSGPWVLEKDGFVSVPDEIRKLREEIADNGADAIGETGIDMHWNYGSIDEQKRLFRGQIELSKELDKALIIHSRDAEEDTAAMLPYMGERIIFHCFTYGVEMLDKALDRGAYISFAANISYRGSERSREAARLCPISRILYETDSPYLAPRSEISRINRPELTEFTLEYLAKLRDEDPDEIRQNAIENLYRVLGYRKSKVKRYI